MRTLFLLISLWCLFSCQQAEKAKLKELPRTIHTVEVSSEDLVERRILPGLIQSVDSVPLAFEVPGKVEQIKVDLGQAFRSGDLLASLEDTTFQLALKQRRGQLQEAKARLEQTRADYQRKADLVTDQSVSQAAFEAAKANYEAAQNAVAIAQAQVEIAQENLADTKLTAPYDGSVAQRMVEPNQQVQPGQPILAVQGQRGLEVAVQVPETLLADLELGKQHTMRIPALNQELTARLTEIGSRSSSGNAFPITLLLNDAPPSLKPGMSAEVALKLDRSGSAKFVLPLTAIQADEADGHRVFVFNPEQGSVQIRSIVVAEFLNEQALITEGLNDGERVVSKGARYLSDGEKVRLAEDKPNWYQQ